VQIKLAESFRAVFYAPFYATQALGLYAREGVEVEFLSSFVPGSGVSALAAGTIDITWGGPMRVMKAHDIQPTSPLVCFCEVVARDPFYLVGSKHHSKFQLAELPLLRFAAVSEAPTPWMCLQHDLRERGIDPSTVDRAAERPVAENFEALCDRQIDVVQVLEPFASMALQRGAGQILCCEHARADRLYDVHHHARQDWAPPRFVYGHDARHPTDAALALRTQGGGIGRSHSGFLPRHRARYSGEFASALSTGWSLGSHSRCFAPGICATRRKPAVRWIYFSDAPIRGLR